MVVRVATCRDTPSWAASAPAQASKPQAPVDDGAKAAALLEGKDAPAASAAVRYVVQVGAFSDGGGLVSASCKNFSMVSPWG